MVRVLALVEGPTERNFGQKLIASHLGMLGIEFHPRVIGKPGHIRWCRLVGSCQEGTRRAHPTRAEQRLHDDV